jgi:hypothetical protein
MNSFVNAVKNQEARTENNMKALASTANKNVDLFYKIGASRGKNIVPEFVGALVENKDFALRIAHWARDVRGGAGERQLYRDVLQYLEKHDEAAALALAVKTPEIGRWDDLLAFQYPTCRQFAFTMIRDALAAHDGLCAKWMPRKGKDAVELRAFLEFTPKRYRKTLVSLTKVVETQMCAKDWDNINFEHVPSLAAARYQKAFNKNASVAYELYKSKLEKGEAKINASALYPYQVVQSVTSHVTQGDLKVANAQWAALPDFIGDASVLALVDVSGSMTCPAGGWASKSRFSCMDVAVSLGLYVADKNAGPFKDTFLTFSGKPELLHLKGSLSQKIDQMKRSSWGMNTDLVAAFKKILSVAILGKVPQADMPNMLLILSDMQFDQCVAHDDSAMQGIEREYTMHGYTVPKVVFWNLHAYENAPVAYDKSGAALVSGFSPAIMKAVLANDLESFTPYSVMLKTIMNERYDY